MSVVRVDTLCDWSRKPAPEIGVDVVIPVLNEAHVLARSVHRVHEFLTEHVPYRWRIVVAENWNPPIWRCRARSAFDGVCENSGVHRHAPVARRICGQEARG